jgi:hypothetical protein
MTNLSEILEAISGEPVSETPLIEIAMHEAAHAVVAAYFGLLVIRVEIGSDNKTTIDPLESPTAQQVLLIAQAGSAAQCRLRQVASDWTVEGSVNDRFLVEDIGEAPLLDPTDFTEIDHLLHDPVLWDRIAKLADALLINNCIEEPELRRFISSPAYRNNWQGLIFTHQFS